MIVFSLEYGVRVSTCPILRRFLVQPLNVVDLCVRLRPERRGTQCLPDRRAPHCTLVSSCSSFHRACVPGFSPTAGVPPLRRLAIVPYYITLLLAAIETRTPWGEDASFAQGTTILRVVRLARVFRVFKLGRYSAGMQVGGRQAHAQRGASVAARSGGGAGGA